MSKLVISDESGKIITIQNEIVGDIKDFDIQIIDVPSDKILVSVDPTTKEPIFEDKPKDAFALLQEIKEKLDMQEEISSELEIALYDVAEMLANVLDGGSK